jgi:hypothetical protein
MSLQNQLLASTTLVAMCGVGLAQSVSATPLPTEGYLLSQVTSVSNTDEPNLDTQVPGEVVGVVNDEYVRVRLPAGDTRLVSTQNQVSATNRLRSGSKVILTMRGNRITRVARASNSDLVALEQQTMTEGTAVRPAPPEMIGQTERIDQLQIDQQQIQQQQIQQQQIQQQQIQQRQPAINRQPQVAPAPQPVVQPVRAMW